MTESIRVEFERLAQPPFADLPIRVTVTGRFTRRGGAPVSASVGRQEVEAIMFDPAGTGFVGYLASTPRAGDALVLQRGGFMFETGVRFQPPAGAQSLGGGTGEDELLYDPVYESASSQPGQAFESHAAFDGARPALGLDVPRGARRLDPTGHALSLTARSWIIEGPGLTPDRRAFLPSTRDKSARISLTVQCPRLPAGGSIRWSVPPANAGTITLSGNPATMSNVFTGATVDIIGLKPGLSAVDVEARDASGRTLESIKFPLCTPQFVLVEDSGAAFDTVLTGFHLADSKEQVFEVAKQVCERVLAAVNVRTVWNMAPFRERLPPQFAGGGVAASRVTIATIAGNPPRRGLPGQTHCGAGGCGPGSFTESIDVWPGAYADAGAGAASEIDDVTLTAMAAIVGMSMMSSPEKEKAIQLLGRLIGETLSHEIVHSLVGFTLTGGDHNRPAKPHSLMNQGVDRSLADRTGIRPVASPVSIDNTVDDGIGAINLPADDAKTQIDRHFPVPPVFA